MPFPPAGNDAVTLLITMLQTEFDNDPPIQVIGNLQISHCKPPGSIDTFGDLRTFVCALPAKQ